MTWGCKEDRDKKGGSPNQTQWARGQAVEEVPVGHEWLTWRVRWHGMCGGQGIHLKGLKCQAESFFSRLKRAGILRVYKDGTTWKVVGTREFGGLRTTVLIITTQAEEGASCFGTPCQPPPQPKSRLGQILSYKWNWRPGTLQETVPTHTSQREA